MPNASQVQSVIGTFLLIKVKHFSLFLEKDKSGCKRGKLKSRCSKNVEKCPEKHLYWCSLSRWKVANILRGIFKTLSNTYDGGFWLRVVNFFHKKLYLRFLTGFRIRLWYYQPTTCIFLEILRQFIYKP